MAHIVRRFYGQHLMVVLWLISSDGFMAVILWWYYGSYRQTVLWSSSIVVLRCISSDGFMANIYGSITVHMVRRFYGQHLMMVFLASQGSFKVNILRRFYGSFLQITFLPGILWWFYTLYIIVFVRVYNVWRGT